MSDSGSHQTRVKDLLAQDPDINEPQMEEFRMQLQETLKSHEKQSEKARRRILIGIGVYLASMTICWILASQWRNAAANAEAALIRGLVYWPFVISGLAAAVTVIWLLARYIFKYAPQLSRTRFDLQTSVMLDLQQQVKQLREDMGRREK